MLEVSSVRVAFGGNEVLHDITMSVESGEIVCLLGPSGCGKTTLLRAIAGLEPLEFGEIRLEGESIDAIPVHARDFGLMFQEFALFPHMNVRENIRFGLRMRGEVKPDQRVEEVLSLVGLSGFGDRDVTMLSGGERQRVALARSLAPRPRLLMLDEPLGSLDAALRERLIVDLKAIVKQIGLTAIYVTHDQQEAFAIADRVAVMSNGKILQFSEPEMLYYQPETEAVARFLGFKNIIAIAAWEADEVMHELDVIREVNSANSVLIHPDGIVISDDGPIAALITERVFTGSVYRLRASYDDVVLQWAISSRMKDVPEVGSLVKLRVDPQAVKYLKG